MNGGELRVNGLLIVDHPKTVNGPGPGAQDQRPEGDGSGAQFRIDGRGHPSMMAGLGWILN